MDSPMYRTISFVPQVMHGRGHNFCNDQRIGDGTNDSRRHKLRI
jgi:hypothetical protein